MEIGVAVPSSGPASDRAVVGDLVDAVEGLGFAAAWFSDHVAVPGYAVDYVAAPYLEPLALCAWGLARTTRLRFGTDVLVGPYRHPLLTAATAGTLGTLGEGRLVLGVGVGYLRGEFEALGLPYDQRAAMTDEVLRVLGGPVEGWSVVAAPERTPVWVGGNVAAARRRAALLGDGWHPLWVPPADYARHRAAIEEARAGAGRTGPFTFSYSCGLTLLTEAGPEAWPQLPPRAEPGSEFRYAPAPMVDGEGRPAFVGTPDQVVADLRALEEAGVDHVVLRPGGDLAHLARLSAEVLPAFA